MFIMRSVLNDGLVILLIGLTALLSGCESSFNPLNQEKGDYSLHGALNVNADTNYVRVKDLDAPFTADSTRELNVTVTLTDVDRGMTETLQDTVVRHGGVYTHNFRALMDIKPATQYRVTVHPAEGSDSIQATTTTPRIAEASAQPTGMDCETPIQLTLKPVQSPDNVDVDVGFRIGGSPQETEVALTRGDAPNEVSASFTPLRILNTPEPCTFPDPSSPLPTWCHQLDAPRLTVRYTHFGPKSTESVVGDSVDAPRGIGTLRSYYRGRLSVPIDDSNVCQPQCDCGGWSRQF